MSSKAQQAMVIWQILITVAVILLVINANLLDADIGDRKQGEWSVEHTCLEKPEQVYDVEILKEGEDWNLYIESDSQNARLWAIVKYCPFCGLKLDD